MKARRPSPACDTLVLGAGAAGLAAAARLASAGQSVILLEARDRVGGRVWTRHARGLDAPLELGAEFIHGRAARASLALLQQAGHAALPVRGQHLTLRGARLAPGDDIFAELHRALPRLHVERGADRSFAEFLAQARRAGVARRVTDFARRLAEGFDAADPERASAQALVAEWTGSGAADASTFRPEAGYDRLLEPLLAAARHGGARLRLRTVVRELRWSAEGVECEARQGRRTLRLRARRAVIALPLGVLQRAPAELGAVRFTPALDAKQCALSLLASGPVLRVVLRFREPFWEELHGGRLCGASFLFAPRAPFPTFWTQSPARSPVLVAWAGGPRAARMGELPRERLVRLALQSLEQLLGPQARVAAQLRSAHVHDWSSDPFARGAYSFALVSGAGARRELARPLRGTLFFAGEATDEAHAATVEGALRSGERAAREVLVAARG